jgi:hypothetical protein
MKKLFILSLLVFSNFSFANYSMRKCMLLPISDSVNGVVAFKVFEELESYLKDSEWCYYKSNSAVMDILRNYKNNLKAHLNRPDVLRIISEKVKAGSLIKIDIISEMKGVNLKLEVRGSNGEDLYFKEEAQVESDQIEVMAQTIINWLEVYEKNIPYDAWITGVLGTQFTLDGGKLFGIGEGDLIEIYRPTSKKRHPLLKEIVDWETMKIGDGKVFFSSSHQSQGNVTEYETKKKTKLKDWIRVKRDKDFSHDKDYKFSQNENKYDFGKLGQIGFFLKVGTLSDTIIADSTDSKKMKGLMIGVDINAELWATRQYWLGIDIGRGFGTIKQKLGTLNKTSNSVTVSTHKFKLGYKYLPMGFFYGPQIDGYIGYASYTYGLDPQASDQFGEVGFKGLLFGAKGDLPLMEKIRVFLSLEFILGTTYKEDVVIFGTEDSASSFGIEIGGVYKYSPTMNIEGSFISNSSKAKFVNSTNNEISIKDSSLKLGASFTF